MRIRPISPPALVAEIADRITARGPGWVRMAVDGADAARPDELAEALADAVRVRGRAAVTARAADHLRPASLRLEHGRRDPDSFYRDWLDVEGLRREVLLPLNAGGDGLIRPARWDAAADRAVRDGFVALPPGGVLLLSGALLLGHGLPFDLTVHLNLSVPALTRRTPPDLTWTLPAYERYAAETRPTDVADIVVRADDPRHPALLER